MDANDEIRLLKLEITRLRRAFSQLENHYEAERVNRHYNNSPVCKVPRKPKKWW